MLMAVTPEEAREFTQDEALFLHGFEIKVDTFIKGTGLGSSETTMTYFIEGQDKSQLNNKAQAEVIKRYNDAGWNASFTFTGNSSNVKDFVLVDPNG